MRFFCIADKDSSLGFRLAGVETREVTTKAEVLEAFQVALATDEIGILVITEKAANFIREEIENCIYQKQLPLILEVPSRDTEGISRDISEFLRKAIGISV
ncbi:MAG TPA: V-type ATP synthase subunit F [bacterium]|nr:V-type ATP synthase subunit F [bacterium]